MRVCFVLHHVKFLPTKRVFECAHVPVEVLRARPDLVVKHYENLNYLFDYLRHCEDDRWSLQAGER